MDSLIVTGIAVAWIGCRVLSYFLTKHVYIRDFKYIGFSKEAGVFHKMFAALGPFALIGSVAVYIMSTLFFQRE